jgi:hypothetical protein
MSIPPSWAISTPSTGPWLRSTALQQAAASAHTDAHTVRALVCSGCSVERGPLGTRSAAGRPDGRESSQVGPSNRLGHWDDRTLPVS